MEAIKNYTNAKSRRPNHLNIDSTEEHRLKRIRCISQGLILKKFQDPKVTIDEKYKLAEKIYLVNCKTDKDSEGLQKETKVIIIRDSNGNQDQSGSVSRPVSVLRV